MDPETLIRADADVDRARRAPFRVLAESGTLSVDSASLTTRTTSSLWALTIQIVNTAGWRKATFKR